MTAVNDAAVEVDEALIEKWLSASRSARKAEYHFPADCLAESVEVYRNLITALATAAEPHLRAAIVEEVAQAIEAKVDGDADGFGDYGPGLTMAARIVRSLATASES